MDVRPELLALFVLAFLIICMFFLFRKTSYLFAPMQAVTFPVKKRLFLIHFFSSVMLTIMLHAFLSTNFGLDDMLQNKIGLRWIVVLIEFLFFSFLIGTLLDIYLRTTNEAFKNWRRSRLKK